MKMATMTFQEWMRQQTENQLQYEGNHNPDYFDVRDRINTFEPYELVTSISEYLEFLNQEK
jgi:hypothetical protein